MLTLTAVGGYFTLRSVWTNTEAMKRGPIPCSSLDQAAALPLPNTPTLTLAKKAYDLHLR